MFFKNEIKKVTNHFLIVKTLATKITSFTTKSLNKRKNPRCADKLLFKMHMCNKIAKWLDYYIGKP